jgi:hypothetical protein
MTMKPYWIRFVGPLIRTAVAVGFVFVAKPASADTITLRYDVQIVSRLDLSIGAGRPFSLQFPLSLTFDDEPRVITPTRAVFGQPEFTPVPIPTPIVGPGLSGANGRVDRFYDPTQTAEGSSDQAVLFNTVMDAGTIVAFTQMFLSRPIFPPPNPGDVSQLFTAGLAADTTFVFTDLREVNGTRVPGSYQYFGVATLLTTAPIPEPASVSLLALGFAGLTARAWRQRGKKH